MNYYDRNVFSFNALFELFEKKMRLNFHAKGGMSPSMDDFKNEMDFMALRGALFAYAHGDTPPYSIGAKVLAIKSKEGVMVLDNHRGPDTIWARNLYTVEACIFIPAQNPSQDPKTPGPDCLWQGSWHIKLNENRHPLQTWPVEFFEPSKIKAYKPRPRKPRFVLTSKKEVLVQGTLL